MILDDLRNIENLKAKGFFIGDEKNSIFIRFNRRTHKIINYQEWVNGKQHGVSYQFDSYHITICEQIWENDIMVSEVTSRPCHFKKQGANTPMIVNSYNINTIINNINTIINNMMTRIIKCN